MNDLSRVGLDNPLFVALDMDDREATLGLARRLSGRVGGFKVGPRLNMRYGGELIRELTSYGHVFVDNKYLDIPNTMAAAIQATFEVGASYATIHAWSGGEALARIAELESQLNHTRSFRVLVVTVLTSFSSATLPGPMQNLSIPEQVLHLATEAYRAGLKGFVCSAEEVETLRHNFPDAFLVTPGIRFPDEERGDQKRVLGPREAIHLGASAIVVGRPICESSDPVAVAERYLQALTEGC